MTDHSGPVLMLASGSPRRRELVRLAGLPVEWTSVDIDETPFPGEAARAYTARLSHTKAQAAAAALAGRPVLILAADTTVADGDLILGKPADPDEARVMLRQLRGRSHQVYTALTLIHVATGQVLTDVAVTDVPMRQYSDDEIEAYIASGDPFDKAGGYAIQNPHFHPALLVSGCFSNVVGLPLCHLARMLRGMGAGPAADIARRCQVYQAYTCDVFEQVLAGQPSGADEVSTGEP